MGMVSVQAFYLPWCMVALNVAMGGSPAADLLVRCAPYTHLPPSRLETASIRAER